MPPNFYATYAKYDINILKQGVWDSFINQIVVRKGSGNCQCREIYPLSIPFKNRDHWLVIFAELMLELDMEENCTQQKCYEYHMSISHLGVNERGVESAACYFFNKELEELNEREILGFIAMIKSPYNYNPNKYPENWNKGIDRLMN